MLKTLHKKFKVSRGKYYTYKTKYQKTYLLVKLEETLIFTLPIHLFNSKFKKKLTIHLFV